MNQCLPSSLRRIGGKAKALPLIVTLGAAVMAVTATSLGLGTSEATAASCATRADSQSTLDRIALNIRESKGKPTSVGAALLAAARSDNSRALSSLFPDGPGVYTVATATNAQPWGNPDVDRANSPTIRTPASIRSRATGLRVTGSTGDYLYNCGSGVAANATWYCKQGSSFCKGVAVFQFEGVRSSDGGPCSIVNVAPCQEYTRAVPGASDWVNYMFFSQSASGQPVVGDRWCG